MIGHEFHIDPQLPVIPEIRYTLERFAVNKKIKISFTPGGTLVSDSENAVLRISEKFIRNFTGNKFSHPENLGPGGFVEHENGSPDYLSTAFYMLACLQEYTPAVSYDPLGRFKYSASYQAAHATASQNVVQFCFDTLAGQLKIPDYKTPTRFFLSHDIDTVYEAVLQDGFYALKRGRIDILLRLLTNVAMSRPDWLNIDQIMKLESMYDARSTFFWIVKKGKAEGLKNADYDFQSGKIQNLVSTVEKNGFENGIHKSISDDSFQTELTRFNANVIANRYHYLKFNLPQGFDAVEQSGLQLDTSLGFAEHIGFRNSYGQPYNPYHLKDRKAYSFTEIPLHVMDTTLFKYNRSDVEEAKTRIISFFEAHKTNCVLSVLWHNNFFSNYKYKGYLPLYKSILVYLKENGLRTISQREVITEFGTR